MEKQMNKQQKDAVIITHSEDPDGIISAVFIADFLKSKNVEYELRFADYSNLAKVIGTATKESGKSFYILDLGLSQAKLSKEAMLTLLENNEVHYFDHHELEIEYRDLFRKKCKTFVSKSEMICTSRLIAEHYKLEKKEYKLLSDCAQATDYYGSISSEFTELGTELAKAISSASELSLQNIVKTLRKGLYHHQIWRKNYNLTGELAKRAVKAQKMMNVAMPQFEQSASCNEIFDNNASTVMTVTAMSADSLNILSGMFAYLLLKEKHPEAHVCFVFYESGSVFAGQGKCLEQTQIMVVEFLKKQGGGGRDNMGGFQYKTPTNTDNYKERKDSLIQDFKNFLNMPYHKERSCPNV